MVQNFADQLYEEIRESKLELLQPIRFTPQQADAIRRGRDNRTDPVFTYHCSGMPLAEFKQCAENNVKEWAGRQTNLFSSKRKYYFGGDDENSDIIPEFVYRVGGQYSRDINKIVSAYFPGSSSTNSFCEIGLNSEERYPELHVHSAPVVVARLVDLPTLLLNKFRLHDARRSIHKLITLDRDINALSPSEDINLLSRQKTGILLAEELLVPGQLGKAVLLLSGTKCNTEDRIENGTPHASSPLVRPTPSAFFASIVDKFYSPNA